MNGPLNVKLISNILENSCPSPSFVIRAIQQCARLVYSRTSHEGPEGEETHSSTLSLTSAIDVLGA